MTNQVNDDNLKKAAGGNTLGSSKYVVGDFLKIYGDETKLFYVVTTYRGDYDWMYKGTLKHGDGSISYTEYPESMISGKADPNSEEVKNF